MQILMLNQDWFKDELIEMGHNVITCGVADHLDVRIPFPLLTYSEICSLCHCTPEIVIIHDNSIPIFFTELETLNVPVLTYCVDVQHHIRYQRYYTQFFDTVFCAQKDYLHEFVDGGSLQWLPLWAPRYVEHSSERRYGAVFVGTMDPSLNPVRVQFFEELGKKIPIECLRGEYWNIFPFSKVVVNQTVRGDLNFRVFEALMCGAALVTELSGNGLTDLFTPGVHLATYERGNVDDAAREVQLLLDNPQKGLAMGTEGRRAVLEHHTARARTRLLVKHLSHHRTTARSFFSLIPNYTALGLYFKDQSESLSLKAFQEVLRIAELGINSQEELSIETARDLIGVCGYVDTRSRSSQASRILASVQESYPERYAEVIHSESIS